MPQESMFNETTITNVKVDPYAEPEMEIKEIGKIQAIVRTLRGADIKRSARRSVSSFPSISKGLTTIHFICEGKPCHLYMNQNGDAELYLQIGEDYYIVKDGKKVADELRAVIR